MVGIILMTDWHLIVRGLTLWRQLSLVPKLCCPESSRFRIVLVPLTKRGSVTRIGMDRYKIGKVLARIGMRLRMDWNEIYIRMTMDRHRIGNGLILDWQCIGTSLAMDWHICR